MLADCRALARELGDGAVAVGLAVCELVDPHGRVRSAETVDWRATDLLGDVRLASSPTCAPPRCAEARFGAGRDEPDFLYVSVGSGISHCLMSGGAPRLGVRGSAIGTGAPLVERVVERPRARAPHRARDAPRRRSPIRPRPRSSRTPRGGSAWCSPRSSTRSTPAR